MCARRSSIQNHKTEQHPKLARKLSRMHARHTAKAMPSGRRVDKEKYRGSIERNLSEHRSLGAPSGKYLLHHIPGHIGETKISSCVAVCEPFVIEAEQMQHGGV